jgi:phosphate transport system permease protein
VKLPRPQHLGDSIFRLATAACAALLLILVVGIALELLRNAIPAMQRFGLGFLWSSNWDPARMEFGALGTIFGTVVSTLIAMLIAVPLSIVIALFLVELAPPRLALPVGYAIELLAAIPSIIYGMWGLFVFAPLMSTHVQPFLASTGLPLFSGPPMGIGMLTAGIILALMILPFITAVMRDVFRMVPPVLKESAYGMGATTWEVTRQVTLPYGMNGLVGATFLGLGRALGETMAVTFVIGNRHSVETSLFAAGSSIASTLANEFTEAPEMMYRSALIGLGFTLLVITILTQIAAQLWLRRVGRGFGGMR